MAVVVDPSSSSNLTDVVVKHFDLQLEVDFASNKLVCTADLHVCTLREGVAELIVDTSELSITGITNSANGEKLQFELKETKGAFGTPLHIVLPSSTSNKGSEIHICVKYETAPSCSAVQWLTPAQTAGKRHPYLYTQCQAIYARSMLPCQDSPSVKSTYTAKVTVPRELVALMSGEQLDSEAHPSDPSKRVFTFRQTIPISSYLIALVVGDLESRKIGPRTHVWSEKEIVDQAAWEFDETETMLKSAEDIAGPYMWGQYDILVLPPSFPHGGMENPCLTFVSPTILAGDRTLANVIAHEISHSWTGNLVTNKTWEEVWLNEGITTFLERRIIGMIHGEKERHLQAMGGWKDLRDDVERLEQAGKSEFTPLILDLAGVHPDDVSSKIPYEKGSAFLFYLEKLLGGPGALDNFLKAYVQKYKFMTVTSAEWKEFFLQYFHKEAEEGRFAEVEWKNWMYDTGMPTYTPTYDTSLADASADLADRWSDTDPSEAALSVFSSTDITAMSSQSLQEFFNQLLSKPPLQVTVLHAMDAVYEFNKTENCEIKFRWLKLCLRSQWQDSFPYVVDFVTKFGRMKYLRPLYKGLHGCGQEGKDLAVATFQANKELYHYFATQLLKKDLQL